MAVLAALFTSKDEDELIRIARIEKDPVLRAARPHAASPARHAEGAQVPGRESRRARVRRSSSTAHGQLRLRYSRPYVRFTGRRMPTRCSTACASNPRRNRPRSSSSARPAISPGASCCPRSTSLSRGQRLPARFNVVGVARSPMTDDQFRQHFHDSLKEFAGVDEARRSLDGAGRASSATSRGRWTIPASTRGSTAKLAEMGCPDGVLFYLAIPPTVYGTVVEQLSAAGLTTPATPGGLAPRHRREAVRHRSRRARAS